MSTPGVWPCLTYADAPAAIRFLVDVLGFVERARHPGEAEGQVAHAELRWPGGGGVMLGSARPGGLGGVPAGTGVVYVETQDPDALHARAVAGGAEVVRELTDQDYGSREFAVRDPEGVVWSFGTWTGE